MRNSSMYRYFHRDRMLANPKPPKFYAAMDGLETKRMDEQEAIDTAKRLALKFIFKVGVYCDENQIGYADPGHWPPRFVRLKA